MFKDVNTARTHTILPSHFLFFFTYGKLEDGAQALSADQKMNLRTEASCQVEQAYIQEESRSLLTLSLLYQPWATYRLIRYERNNYLDVLLYVAESKFNQTA